MRIINDSINYIGREQILYGISSVVNDRNFRMNVTRKFGKEVMNYIDTWGEGLVKKPANMEFLEKVVTKLKNNATVGILMLRLMTGFKQYGSLLTAAPEVGRINLMNATSEWMSMGHKARMEHLESLTKNLKSWID